MISFTPAVESVLKYEGGYVDNPLDPGGSTNYGITQRTLNEFRRTHETYGFPTSVKDLNIIHAKIIYELMYWNTNLFNQIEASVDSKYQPVVNKVFDMFVNMGPLHALQILQFACNIFMPTVPGIFSFMDQWTWLCDVKPPNQKDTCLMLNLKMGCVNFRLERVRQSPSQVTFLHGWLNRDVDG